MKRLLARLALAASALMLGIAGANANVLVTIEQDGFGSGPIKVVSEDGKKWTKILDGDLTMPVKIYLGISSGYLTSYEIKQAATTIFQGGEWVPGTNAHQQNLNLTGSTKNFAIEALTILGACNDRLDVGQGIHQKHTFWHGVELELVGYFNMTNDDNYPPYSGYGTVAVPVECLPYQGASGDVTVSGGDSNAPMIIKEAKLFLTTYSGQNDGVTLGGCKALKTTVRFETNKSGPVSFDLNRFPGGMTSHTVNAEFDPGVGQVLRPLREERDRSRARRTCNTWRSRPRRSAAIPAGRTSPSIAAADCTGHAARRTRMTVCPRRRSSRAISASWPTTARAARARPRR